MWIVNLALRHPTIFVVLALIIVVLGDTSGVNMRTDVFPGFSVLWTQLSVVQRLTMPIPSPRGMDSFDPSAVRAANREVIMEAANLNQSGVVRIFMPSSPKRGTDAYDSGDVVRNRAVAGVLQRTGERSGNTGLTADASQSADPAARSVGSAGLE